MRFRRKKFRHNFLIFLVFMSLFLHLQLDLTTILYEIKSFSNLSKKERRKNILQNFCQKKTGLKVKTSNFFYQSAFTQNAAFFVSIICAWIIEVEKTKHKRKVSRLRQNMQSSRQNEREFSRRKRETFFVVVQKGISLQYIALCMKTAILETFFFVYASIFSHHSGEQEDIRGGWFSEQYVVVGSFQGFSSNFLFLQQVRRNATFFSTKSQRTIFLLLFHHAFKVNLYSSSFMLEFCMAPTLKRQK